MCNMRRKSLTTWLILSTLAILAIKVGAVPMFSMNSNSYQDRMGSQDVSNGFLGGRSNQPWGGASSNSMGGSGASNKWNSANMNTDQPINPMGMKAPNSMMNMNNIENGVDRRNAPPSSLTGRVEAQQPAEPVVPKDLQTIMSEFEWSSKMGKEQHLDALRQMEERQAAEAAAKKNAMQPPSLFGNMFGDKAKVQGSSSQYPTSFMTGVGNQRNDAQKPVFNSKVSWQYSNTLSENPMKGNSQEQRPKGLNAFAGASNQFGSENVQAGSSSWNKPSGLETNNQGLMGSNRAISSSAGAFSSYMNQKRSQFDGMQQEQTSNGFGRFGRGLLGLNNEQQPLIGQGQQPSMELQGQAMTQQLAPNLPKDSLQQYQATQESMYNQAMSPMDANNQQQLQSGESVHMLDTAASTADELGDLEIDIQDPELHQAYMEAHAAIKYAIERIQQMSPDELALFKCASSKALEQISNDLSAGIDQTMSA